MADPHPSAGEGAASAAKAGVSWIGALLAHSTLSLADLASILASCYTVLLIVEWFWRRLGRPYLERTGRVKRKRRRRTDIEDDGGAS